MLEAEQRRIFERTWQLAGHVSQLPGPGRYLTAQAGTQPVLVLRGNDGELRAFRNVCRHRGSRVLSGSGECGKALRCRYHGWTYRLDGSLIGVPEARAYEGLDKSGLGLLPARVEVAMGLIFVNLDPRAASLAELLGDLPDRLARYGIESLIPFRPQRGHQPVNWKIVVDNYLEGYHVPIAHPGLMRLLDYRRYEADVREHYVWVEGPLRERPSGTPKERLYRRLIRPIGDLGEDDVRAWRYVFIYPNTAIDLYPDQVATWQIRPDGVRGTDDTFMSYRAARPGLRNRIVQRLNLSMNIDVHLEDVDLVENVQAGLETSGYVPGPLSRRENAVAWFADRIRSDLGEARAEPVPETKAEPAPAEVAAG